MWVACSTDSGQVKVNCPAGNVQGVMWVACSTDSGQVEVNCPAGNIQGV